MPLRASMLATVRNPALLACSSTARGERTVSAEGILSNALTVRKREIAIEHVCRNLPPLGQLSGAAALGDVKGGLSVAGGTSPQNVEVMKTFLRRCPTVLVTGNREKADFVVRLDHEEPNPTTLFVRGNKVAVFNRNDDLIYSTSTRTLTSAVKSACEAIAGGSRK